MRKVSSQGYTLLEVLVVVFILGLLSAVSIPNFIEWLHAYRLQSAAATLSNHLQSTRLLAILKGTPHQIQLREAAEGNYYQVVEDPGGEDRIVITIGRVILDKEFRGVIIHEVKPKTSKGKLTFEPKGTARSGRITLKNSRGGAIEIRITHNGRIRLTYL